MPALDFSKWSPGGNTTLFFPAAGLDAARQAELARQAMRPDSLGAEQAGFVSVEERRLRMAGGEFCVNATRAFGALLAFRESASPEATLQGIARQKLANEHRYEVQVSGWQTPIRLQVRGTSPHWQVRAELQLPPCPITHPEQGIHLVRLPGICHLLLDGEVHMQPEDCIAASRMLRRQYGMVLQDTWLKTASVRENIRLAKPDATDAEVEAAARMAHADSFILRLPEGYDTVLSDTGGALSAGQRQLLCIARVMLCLPPMLILDEATSSIDTRTEAHIQQAFDTMMQGRTSFVVAHRLSTIREADVILVMKDGHIIEQGRHEDLLAKNGFYANLYHSQFEG